MTYLPSGSIQLSRTKKICVLPCRLGVLTLGFACCRAAYARSPSLRENNKFIPTLTRWDVFENI